MIRGMPLVSWGDDALRDDSNQQPAAAAIEVPGRLRSVGWADSWSCYIIAMVDLGSGGISNSGFTRYD